jgi:hypothetical protein
MVTVQASPPSLQSSCNSDNLKEKKKRRRKKKTTKQMQQKA